MPRKGIGSTVNTLFSNPQFQNWASGGSGTGGVDTGTWTV